ncbi:hypothetical protein AwDysgo_21510 [Bacteroidales bacterium]|nr:hypothetical protein AwDysgo_21510 [Bacteroidales bacterium]
MSGNISKEGVIKDLEEMKRVGINRAFIGNIYFNPEGGRNVKLMSDEWWDVTHAALKRASELDIEIGMFNSPGWSHAGGPWVKTTEAMRYLTSTELRVKGGQSISAQLRKPHGEFQDVKVIAYPAPKDDRLIVNKSNAAIKTSPTLKDADRMFDGNISTNPNTGTGIPQNVEVSIDLVPHADFTARSITIYPTREHFNATFDLQAKVGTAFQSISQFTINYQTDYLPVGILSHAPVVISFNETTAKEFRLLVNNQRNEGGIAELEISSSPRIENYSQKTLTKMCPDPMPLWNYYMWRDTKQANNADLVIDPTKVIDISQHMTTDGILSWDAPAGDWVIIRTGMTPTGVTNNPGGPDGTGLEVDKISKHHIASHFEEFIGKVLKRIPAQDRTSFKVVIQDSYESGAMNFTDDFLDAFKERYGYDALPFLPTYFGYVVGNEAQSDKFLWDLRRIVADKVAYNYVGGFRKLCHENGLTTWLENYGHWGFPAEFLQYGGQSDEVGGEYWLPNAHPSWENDLGNIENRAASSCAHIYGKNLVSAESNTSGGPVFSRTPTDAKQRTDKYFAEGINNTLLHVFYHQPDLDKYPGVNDWFGTEFTRTNTWYSHIDLFIDYVKRCNYMLRQGLNIADVAYFIGEDTPKMTGVCDPALPQGYQFDYINAEVILRDASVKNGLLTLPHGTSYRVLVLPKVETMRPEVLTKIKQLIADGAIVLGPAPTQSPSLQDQPQADIEIKKMAQDLWGSIKGSSTAFGKGMLFDGVGLEEVFAKIGATQDCKIPTGAPIHFGHRQMGGTDIYFVSNQSETTQNTDIKFRVKGMQPELWNPMDGTTRKLTEFTADTDGTLVPLVLQAHQSAFVVFRNSGKPIAGTINFPNPSKEIELKLAWNVEFNGKLTNPAPIQLDQLKDLATSADELVKYFSGNMIYTTSFDFDQESAKGEDVYLNLGEVNKMAKVWINDQYVGGVWTPPYSLNISSALKQGPNALRIDVVNTWTNRMIGDKIVAPEKRETWAGQNTYSPDSPLQKSGLIGPVRLEQIPLQ